MRETAALAPWVSFYAMTGASAAALIGLMFVVVTLITGTPRARSQEGTATYSTPTVVHFCAALLVSATLAAPWSALIPACVVLGLTGLAGIVFVFYVCYRINAMRRNSYTADWEDWAWHAVLPLLAYAAILAAAITVPAHAPSMLFAPAAAVVMLLFIGIHNAWDIVTYLTIESPEP